MSDVSQKLLRAEGALALISALYVYAQLDAAWLMFALLFFVPDIALFRYIRRQSFGHHVYNFGHTYIVPFGLLIFGLLEYYETVIAVAIIWFAHIGFDRMLGLGFKSPQSTLE